MNKVLSVIRRELMERVRTRAFILSTFLMPIFLIAVLVLPAVMMSGGERSSRMRAKASACVSDPLAFTSCCRLSVPHRA